MAAKRRLAITQVQKNDTVYLNLRHFDFFTYEWYDKIGFPDKTLCYFIPIRIGDWVAARSKLKVYAYLITHGNKKIILDYYDLMAYVLLTAPTPMEGHILSSTDNDLYPAAWRDLFPSWTK